MPGLPVLQPQMGVTLTATLSDGDGVTDATLKWQVVPGQHRDHRRPPRAYDAGLTSTYYASGERQVRSALTAKATYMDGEDANNQKMADSSRTRTVRAAPEDNTRPSSPTRNPT